MLDLFAGLGGASQAMIDRGWRVVRVDLEPRLRPDVVADVAHLPLRWQPDLLWAAVRGLQRHPPPAVPSTAAPAEP
jgi:hypothetical protein